MVLMHHVVLMNQIKVLPLDVAIITTQLIHVAARRSLHSSMSDTVGVGDEVGDGPVFPPSVPSIDMVVRGIVPGDTAAVSASQAAIKHKQPPDNALPAALTIATVTFSVAASFAASVVHTADVRIDDEARIHHDEQTGAYSIIAHPGPDRCTIPVLGHNTAETK